MPKLLIGDKAYDSDPLDAELAAMRCYRSATKSSRRGQTAPA